MESLKLAKRAARALDDKKAVDLRLLRVEDITILADYFLIASGTSSTHVGALADEVEFKLSEAGVKPLHVEGAQSRSWVLLDYGDVVVHLFYPEDHDYYALKRLWADAQPVPLDFSDDGL